jgi:hypothetical protein
MLWPLNSSYFILHLILTGRHDRWSIWDGRLSPWPSAPGPAVRYPTRNRHISDQIAWTYYSLRFPTRNRHISYQTAWSITLYFEIPNPQPPHFGPNRLKHNTVLWDSQPATATFRTKPPETYYCNLRFPTRNRHTLDQIACNILVWDSQSATATVSLLLTPATSTFWTFAWFSYFSWRNFSTNLKWISLCFPLCNVHVLHSTYKGVRVWMLAI